MGGLGTCIVEVFLYGSRSKSLFGEVIQRKCSDCRVYIFS